jgi:hypothetical protein
MNVVAVLLRQGHGNSGEVLEETQHFIVGRVVWQEERQVRVTQDGSNTDQTSTTTGDNGNVLPSILALFSLSVGLVVELGNSLSQRLDTSCRAVLTASHGDVDGLGTREAALDIVLDFGGTLAKVGP